MSEGALLNSYLGMLSSSIIDVRLQVPGVNTANVRYSCNYVEVGVVRHMPSSLQHGWWTWQHCCLHQAGRQVAKEALPANAPTAA
jgi:hypothetical protein